jgi:hypothetical protein
VPQNAPPAVGHKDESFRQDGVALFFAGSSSERFPRTDDATFKMFCGPAEKRKSSASGEDDN